MELLDYKYISNDVLVKTNLLTFISCAFVCGTK